MKPLVNYFKASRTELTKVTWPTRRQTARLTGVVLVFALVITLVIGTLDYLFSLGLQKIIAA